MNRRTCFIQIVVLLGFSGAFAAPSNVARLKTNLRKAEPSRWSLLVPSFVVHGAQPARSAAAEMPRRMDGGGVSVVTPGLGFEYADPGGAVVMGAVFKDCYDGLAGTLQFGSFYPVSRETRVGWSLGLYARETPMSCTESVGPFGTRTTTCERVEDIPWGFRMTANGYPVDLIPMPFLHLSHTMLANRGFEVDLRLMSNVILNEVGIALRF